MDVKEIRDALHTHPFVPFSLRLADGRVLSVYHPEYVAVSPRRVVHINFQDEAISILTPPLIVSIGQPETLDAPEAPAADNSP